MSMVSKSEIISKIAESNEGITKKDTEIIVNAVFDNIISEISVGNKVQIIGFGSFERGFRKEHIGHNPKTKSEITVPESHYPKFKAGKSFKESCNK
jgi:DNA-binding protein HU-beta